MNAIRYDAPEEEQWDTVEGVALPGRPRRNVLTWWSAGLFALILCAVGFYAGVRVEKGQLASSSSTSAFSAASAAARGGAAGRAGARAGLRGGLGGAGAVGGATFGTVSSISGNSLFVTDTSGDTVKVTLSSATKVTKAVGVGRKAVRPGDLVAVSGAKGTNGTVSATTVSDTGGSPAAASGGGSRSSGSGSSGSSAVNQLFGGG
jgi:hypothetical protein